jgi:hypothetical protein
MLNPEQIGPVVPVWVRVTLWLPVALAVLVTLVMSVTVIAGNRSADSRPARDMAVVALVLLAVQAGYFAAPFAVGRSWWIWPCLAMLPLAMLLCGVSVMSVCNAFRWTRPDGAGPWTSIAAMGWFSLVGLILYAAPPVLLWWFRPQW